MNIDQLLEQPKWHKYVDMLVLGLLAIIIGSLIGMAVYQLQPATNTHFISPESRYDHGLLIQQG